MVCYYGNLMYVMIRRSPESYLWKLNRTENFSRMRLKLSRDYSNVGRHRDASNMRDIGTIHDIFVEPSSADTALLSLVKVSTRYTTFDHLGNHHHVTITLGHHHYQKRMKL